MSNGGMDGFDWLQNFLPADSQPDHDPNPNNEAYRTHPAFHDAEEVARAAVMHQQAHNSYSFTRTTNPGTNHASNSPKVYSQASGGQYGGNKHQQTSNTQSNNSPSGHSTYPKARSHNTNQQPNPPVPSQQHLNAQPQFPDVNATVHGTRDGSTSSKNTYAGCFAKQFLQPLYNSTPQCPTTPSFHCSARNTAHAPSSKDTYPGGKAPTIAKPIPKPLSNLSPEYPATICSAAAQRPWPGPAVQRKHTPVARVQASQSPYQNNPAVPVQNVQRSSHPSAPPSSHSSIDSQFYTPLVSPKGFKTSAARNTLEPHQSITPAKSTQEISNPRTQNPATNSTRSSHVPPRPSFHNQDHVQSTVPTASHRVHSPATSQPVSTRSPSLSLVSSAPTSASAPPAQTTIVPHQLDKGWTQEKKGTQGNAAPTSSYQAPNQESQQPPISQPNEQSTPVVPSAYASPTPAAASHLGPSYNASHTSGPRRGTFSDSSVAQQPAAGNTQSRDYPLSGPLHHQKTRLVPNEENSMPPAKVQRLDNGKSQTMTLQNNPSASSSVPGAQVSTEYTQPRGSGKFLKNRVDLVQPIRWSDALPKVSYDPTTIARDVLIAAARHPTEKHLNHHLEPLRHNFTKIDYLANLATFRWDLVDVKQPETQVNRVPPVHAPHMPPLQSPHLQQPHPQPPQAARHSVSRDPTVIPYHVITRDYVPMPPRDTPPNRQVAMPERIDARAPPGGLSSWGTLPFKPPDLSFSSTHFLFTKLAFWTSQN
ncbi:hypothetical protein HAV15_001519 [Penicillium sp. str. |nr:hypothetical protein HAV15_001519 [Penicillium sp. str. \